MLHSTMPLFFGELVRPNIDIVDSQLLNLLHGFLFRPFTDSNHGHYSRNPADDPQDREQGAEFLLKERKAGGLEQKPELIALFIGDSHCADT